eukprot:TRINITY_DN440_c0_g1_i11.p1 TRINITY_DN440_c0_g1~~TRINITY_DN440_c0_g1_i11.p1  ORF type:complete len:363 (+),score=76.05 TRINITY_DN440_c0_g1_i11:75-1163(+)
MSINSRLFVFLVSFILLVLGCKGGGTLKFDLHPTTGFINDNSGNWGYAVVYLVNMPMGTPVQYVPVIADSGSPLLIVFGRNCTDPDCQGKTLFNQEESSSWVDLHEPFIASYGAGKISGVKGEEYFSLSSSSGMNFLFALIDKVNWTEPGAQNLNMSGVCGLSLAPSQYNNQSFLQSAYDNGLIKYNMFGFGVSSDLSTPGELVLGGYDDSYFTGDLQWHGVLKDYNLGFLYLLNGTGVKVNGKVIPSSCTSTLCPFLVDTGGGVFEVRAPGFPSLAVESDCSNVSQLPTFSIFIDNNEYEFTPADYILKIPNPNGSGTICVSTAIGADGPVVTADIAGWFFHKYYAVFDRQNQVVGFAPRN